MFHNSGLAVGWRGFPILRYALNRTESTDYRLIDICFGCLYVSFTGLLVGFAIHKPVLLNS
jgi:hypothetical protein